MCDCCDYIRARGGAPDDPRLIAEYEKQWRRKTNADVARSGWAVMKIEGPLPWAYTIGLWSARGHPELVVFGMAPTAAHELLNALAHGVAEHGETFSDGDLVELPTLTVTLFDVPNPGDVVLRANMFSRRPASRSVPALQVVYPDAVGRWPWEPTCATPARWQPMPGEFVA